LGDLSLGELMENDMEDVGSSDEYTSSEAETSSDSSEEAEDVMVPPKMPRPAATPATPGHATVKRMKSKKSLPSLPNNDHSPPPPLPTKDHPPHVRPALHVATDARSHGSSSSNGPPHRPKPLETGHSRIPSGSNSAGHPTPLPTPGPVRKKKGPAPIKEPELKLIPDLLPVFIEMIRPKLRPRAVAPSN